MARQKHAQQSLFEALAQFFRRARTSLYQPFAEPPASTLPAESIALVRTPPPIAQPAKMQQAKMQPTNIIPFPSAARTAPASRDTSRYAFKPRILSFPA